MFTGKVDSMFTVHVRESGMSLVAHGLQHLANKWMDLPDRHTKEKLEGCRGDFGIRSLGNLAYDMKDKAVQQQKSDKQRPSYTYKEKEDCTKSKMRNGSRDRRKWTR